MKMTRRKRRKKKRRKERKKKMKILRKTKKRLKMGKKERRGKMRTGKERWKRPLRNGRRRGSERSWRNNRYGYRTIESTSFVWWWLRKKLLSTRKFSCGCSVVSFIIANWPKKILPCENNTLLCPLLTSTVFQFFLNYDFHFE